MGNIQIFVLHIEKKYFYVIIIPLNNWRNKNEF